MKAFLYGSYLRFFAILLALFVAGCVANHFLQVPGTGTGFERLYALIPCLLFFASRFLVSSSAAPTR